MSPKSAHSYNSPPDLTDEVPSISSIESFGDVVDKLLLYISRAVDAAYTYEQLRTSFAGQSLRPLITSLSSDCHHPAIVAALLATRYQFRSLENDGSGLNESRALACEFVAWQFLTFLSEKELMDYLLYELPQPKSTEDALANTSPQAANGNTSNVPSTADDETAQLLQPQATASERAGLVGPHHTQTGTGTSESGFTGTGNSRSRLKSSAELPEELAGMNALEIALVCNAKKFISAQPCQKIVTDVWNGDIVFWESLSVNAQKKPVVYKKRAADPFIRLRVPKYQKAFQVLFFFTFLALYYAVLVARNPQHINLSEVLLYVWIVAFAYDEFGEIQDAGLMFYRTDFWSLWDVAIIIVAVAFTITRAIGLIKGDPDLIDTSFDILSMVALFLVPRLFSMFSLNSYFGSLIPVLKEMVNPLPDPIPFHALTASKTKAFCKFLPVIVVLYLGFLTTFSMLARDKISINEMSWILIKVFFGSSYLGFDVAVTISPLFGYTLMLIFVCLTNILLLTSLVSLVSNSLTEVMAHAREEYLFQYSIYVLESSTSGRLTYFMPPLNLIPLFLLRPLRLILPSENVRAIRIVVLKATHAPFVAVIWIYERSMQLWDSAASALALRGPHSSTSHHPNHMEPDVGRSPIKHRSYRLTRREVHSTATVTAHPTSVAGTIDNADLVALIQSLSTKVDDLAALVAGQQAN